MTLARHQPCPALVHRNVLAVASARTVLPGPCFHSKIGELVPSAVVKHQPKGALRIPKQNSQIPTSVHGYAVRVRAIAVGIRPSNLRAQRLALCVKPLQKQVTGRGLGAGPLNPGHHIHVGTWSGLNGRVLLTKLALGSYRELSPEGRPARLKARRLDTIGGAGVHHEDVLVVTHRIIINPALYGDRGALGRLIDLAVTVVIFVVSADLFGGRACARLANAFHTRLLGGTLLVAASAMEVVALCVETSTRAETLTCRTGRFAHTFDAGFLRSACVSASPTVLLVVLKIFARAAAIALSRGAAQLTASRHASLSCFASVAASATVLTVRRGVHTLAAAERGS